MVGVVAGGVQDGDADQAAGVDVGVPNLAEELHGGRGEGVVVGELELGGEDAALEGGALGPLDQRLPVEQVVFRHGACRDAVRWVVGEHPVLLEEPTVGGRGHGWRVLGRSDRRWVLGCFGCPRNVHQYSVRTLETGGASLVYLIKAGTTPYLQGS